MKLLQTLFNDPALAYYYGQKAIRQPGVRRALGHAVSRLGPRPLPAADPLVQRAVHDLQRDGFAPLPEKTLDPARLQAIHAHYDACLASDNYDPQLAFRPSRDVPPACRRAAYAMQDTLACVPLMQLANDPQVLAAVAQRLGCKPTLASVESWWTFGENNPDGRASPDDIFHRDVDDLRFVKLFAYLTDTGVDNGAHCYVLKSHRSGLLTRRGAITDAQVHEAFGSQDLMTVTGPAGTAFLEETWGIHRPLMARRGRRLIFSAIYTVRTRLPATRRSPLPLPSGFDPYVNRHLYTGASA